MIITVCKRFEFAASHQLPYHQGQCRFLHGHNYGVQVVVASPALQTEGSARGMVMDFGDLKAVMKPLLDRLDHSHLNEFQPNPTAENIAGAIICYLASRLPSGWCRLSVTVSETGTAAATVEMEYEDWQRLQGNLPDEWRLREFETDTERPNTET